MQRSIFPRSASLMSALVCVFAASVAWAGPKAYVGNFKDNTVSVIDTATAAVIVTIPVALGPHGMGVTPDGRTVYVSGDGGSTVTAIDTATDRVTGQIEVGKTPHGLAMQPDGKYFLVGVYGEDRVAWVDTASGTVVDSVAVSKPHTIAIHPDGKTAWVSSQQPGKFALVVIDLAARKAVRSLPLEQPPRDLEFGFDGRALYFTTAGSNAVRVLDPSTDKIIASVPTGVSPHLASVFRGAPAGLALVQGPGELLLFDPATNAPGQSIAVGKQPHWMAPYNRGLAVLVTNEGSDDVSLVDLAKRTSRTVPVGRAPRKVVVQPEAPADAANAQPAAVPGGNKVSINNFAFQPATLSVAVGDSVTWANDDGSPHGLQFKDGSQGKDLMLPKESFRRSFDQPGTYDYACSVHPYMSGAIVVRRRPS